MRLAHLILVLPSVLLGVAAAPPLFAQVYSVPDGNGRSGACELVPFGSDTLSTATGNHRYQCMLTMSDLGKATSLRICDLAFAACGQGLRHFDSIEIVMAQTKATTLSTTFSANLVTNARTVLRAVHYEWVNNLDWAVIGLDQDYAYSSAGGNLVVQVTVRGAWLRVRGAPGMRAGTRQRLVASGWTSSPPTRGSSSNRALKIQVLAQTASVHSFGRSCFGNNPSNTPTMVVSGSGKLGSSLSIQLWAQQRGISAILSANTSRREPRFDLGVAGAPGCGLYVDNRITLFGVTDQSGVLSIAAKVPNDKSLLCARFFVQGFPVDPRANALGVLASNYVRVVVGS